MRDITLGQYYPQDSVIHELDPRTKLMGVLMYIISLFLIKDPIYYIGFLVLVVALFKVANVPFSFFMKGLKSIVILLVFTFFFRLVCTPGTEIASFWIFVITKEGVIKAIKMTSRIALMIIGAALLGYTSTPKSLADGLEKAFMPLEKIRIPVKDMAMMTMIAFRFIPVMIESTNDLMDAQASRGAEFYNCSIRKKCKNVCSLLVPIFMDSVKRSADLAMAMEARGYSGEGETSKLNPLAYARKDRIAYVLSFLLLAVTLGIRFH